MKTETKAVDINRNIGDFHYKVDYAKDAGSGLSEKTIHYISDVKKDPDWVREFRAILDRERPGALLGTFHCPWSEEEHSHATSHRQEAGAIPLHQPLLARTHRRRAARARPRHHAGIARCPPVPQPR